jgi:hypothetical protein
MGSLKKSRLSADEIVSRYLAGEGRVELSLRAGIPEPRIRGLLLAHGVALRTREEASVVWQQRRRDWQKQFGWKRTPALCRLGQKKRASLRDAEQAAFAGQGDGQTKESAP